MEPLEAPSAGGGRAGAGLAAVLAGLGWSAEALARHLNDFAGANSVDRRVHPKTPYKWLRGEHPQQPWPDLVAALLASRTQQPITPAVLGWSGATAVSYVRADDGLVQPWTPSGSLRAAVEVAQAGGVLDRRKFLTVAGAAVTVPAHQWLVADVAGSTSSDATGGADATAEAGDPPGRRVRVQDALVDQLDTITGQLRQMDDSIGSTPVIELAQAHLRQVTGLLSDGQYTDAVGRRLHAGLAEILRLCGWLSFDASQQPQAQRFFHAALRAARTAGDDAAGANIVAFMSCQAKELGQVHEAVTLAATAAAGHPHAAGRTRAILALRSAEAHAHARDAGAVRRHVEDAFDHLNDTPVSSGDPAWSYWMDATQAHGQAGYAYLVLGDHGRARHHLRAAARPASGTAPDAAAGPAADLNSGPAPGPANREAVLRAALLATAYAQPPTPDLERALTAGQDALTALSGSVASPRCAGYLATFVATLAPHRNKAAVRDFIDRARTELPTAPAGLIPRAR